MKYRILIVTPYRKGCHGGTVCSNRNCKHISTIFGNENVEVFDLWYKKLNIFQKMFNKISNTIHHRTDIAYLIENEIVTRCKMFDILFIEKSSSGILAKRVKNANPQIKIVTFFHNVEIDYYRNLDYNKYVCWRIHHNENLICKYSDITIALNTRDAKQITQIYGRNIDAIIPISMPIQQIHFNKNPISSIPTALFLGSNVAQNTLGLLWFVKNVLPYVNIKLQVIMRDADKLGMPSCEKMEIFGFVDDLTPYIQNADFMIAPIFNGSGMKVKTCEALKHGKNIIGTHEAFEGYDVDFEKVGDCCETAEEFISAINEFPKRFDNKFNEYSRNIFLEKYTDDVTLKQFTDIFLSKGII